MFLPKRYGSNLIVFRQNILTYFVLNVPSPRRPYVSRDLFRSRGNGRPTEKLLGRKNVKVSVLRVLSFKFVRISHIVRKEGFCLHETETGRMFTVRYKFSIPASRSSFRPFRKGIR